MRRVLACCLAVFSMVCLFSVSAWADTGLASPTSLEREEPEGELSEGDDQAEDPPGEEFDFSFLEGYLDRILDLLEGREEADAEEVPPLHEYFDSASGDGVSVFSIVTHPSYPYTGGGFMALSTNYGSGVVVVPEPFRLDTFGCSRSSLRSCADSWVGQRRHRPMRAACPPRRACRWPLLAGFLKGKAELLFFFSIRFMAVAGLPCAPLVRW